MAQKKIVLGRGLLEANQGTAQKNRLFLEKNQIFAVNIVASPGAGKSSVLLRTAEALHSLWPLAVIEADPGSRKDSDIFRNRGIAVHSIATSLCHLESQDVAVALAELSPAPTSLLFIENVGNLVCPAEYDLGVACTVLLLSATDGEDKPLKYPPLIRQADLCLLTKMDVAPVCGFQWEKAKENLKAINPLIEVLPVSSKTGQGFGDWIFWLMQKKETF
jgi:hydrogenase nickel incorporation protein HypB